MRNFYLIFKKELRSYFLSPVAYVVICIFLVLAGYFFYNILATFSMLSFEATQNPLMAKQYNLLNITESVVRPLFGNISIIMLLMMPMLTMRLLAEEKKSGTIELLSTYPVKDLEIITGKFFAAVAIFAVMLALTIPCFILLSILGSPELGVIVSGYVGLLLMGAAFIALGLWTSSLTENQIIAAAFSFGALLVFWMMGFSVNFAGPRLGSILSYISFLPHLYNFAKGVVDTEDLVYYFNFSIFCLFLTMRTLESKRWRG